MIVQEEEAVLGDNFAYVANANLREDADEGKHMYHMLDEGSSSERPATVQPKRKDDALVEDGVDKKRRKME